MAELDFAKIKRNIGRMIDLGAPESDIDEYVASEGTTAEALRGEQQEAQPERPFTEKLGNFLKNVYENPPPTIAGIRDTLKGARGASMELVNPASPESAEQAAGTMLGAATLASPLTPALRARMGTPVVAPAPPPSRGALEAAGRIGVDIPKYLATEGTAIPQAAAGVKNIPLAGEPIIQSANRLTEQMGRVKNELIPGSKSPEIAGGEAKEALSSWIKEGSQKPVSKAYRAVDELVDPKVMAPLPHTAGAVDEIIASRVRSRIPGTSKAADTVLDAIAGPMDYEGIKGLRTFLGERTPQELIASGINPVEHKRIYAALTKDLENVVREAGGAEALFAWKHANTLARLTSMQRNMLTKITGLKGDAAPEAVFSKISAYAGSKSSADIGKLRLAKSTMGPKAWDEVGSAFLSKLGSTPDGEFSAARFVTGYGNLSTAAKKEIFKPDHLSALDDLYTVSKHIRDRIDRFANPSGTSRSIFTMGALGGAMVDPFSLITSMVGGRIAAEALSRPAVVKAAADVGRATLRRDLVMTRAAADRLSKLLVRGGLVSGTSVRHEGISAPQMFTGDSNSPANDVRIFNEYYPPNKINYKDAYPDLPESKNIEDRRYITSKSNPFMHTADRYRVGRGFYQSEEGKRFQRTLEENRARNNALQAEFEARRKKAR